MSSIPLATETRLSLLRDQFRRRLPDRVLIMEAMLESAASGGSLEELARLFHQLAGSSGTYGLAAISPIARKGEECCRDRDLALPERIAVIRGVLRSLSAAVALENAS